MAGRFNTEDELKDWIKRKLGEDVVNVELSSAQLGDAVGDAESWFIENTLLTKWDSLKPGNQNEFDFSRDEIYKVVDVIFDQETGLAQQFRALDIPFLFKGGFRQSGRGMLVSRIAQLEQHFENLDDITGSEGSWTWLEGANKLRIYPANHNFAEIVYEYVPASIDIAELVGKPENFFSDWALAEAKETLGEVRRKYQSIPTIAGERSLAGDTLVSEAQQAKEDLRNRRSEKQGPTKPLLG